MWGLITAALLSGCFLALIPGPAQSETARYVLGVRTSALHNQAWCRLGRLLPGAGQPDHRAGSTQSRNEGFQHVDAATLLDLTAALLRAGTGIEAAMNRLAHTADGAQPLAQVQRHLSAGSSWEQSVRALQAHPELLQFCAHLRFAYATGAPTASMLEAAAGQARTERRQEAERRAAELGVKMMLPLGACFLPAFILLGVLPVVISMIPDALSM